MAPPVAQDSDQKSGHPRAVTLTGTPADPMPLRSSLAHECRVPYGGMRKGGVERATAQEPQIREQGEGVGWEDHEQEVEEGTHTRARAPRGRFREVALLGLSATRDFIDHTPQTSSPCLSPRPREASGLSPSGQITSHLFC